MNRHVPVQQLDHGRRRWACPDCTWATPWVIYTDPHHGAAAVRHAAAMTRAGDPMPDG